MTTRTIGVDIGGTKMLGVVLDLASGDVVAQRKVPTPRHDPPALVAALGDLIEGLAAHPTPPSAAPAAPSAARSGALRAATEPVAAMAGIGVGLPGLVGLDGVLRYGPNVPGVLDLDVRGVLHERFGVPVVVDNDAAHAARAELRWGSAAGRRHVVVVTQGTGIGGAIVVDGQVVRGANGFAGEPGHMLIDPNGHRCACGHKGCWETVSSGAGLVNLAGELIDEGRGERIVALAGGDRTAVRGEHVSAAFDEGDPDALEVLDRFASWVAAGIGSLVSILDPEMVVLGGGLSDITDQFIEQVRRRVATLTMGGAHRPLPDIVTARFGPEAGAVGAALAAAEADEMRPGGAAS